MTTSLKNLPIKDRLRIVEDLWDSIAADQDQLSLSDKQRQELDLRLDEFELDGELGEPADQILANIRTSL